MSRKNMLAPTIIVAAQSLAADFTSTPTIVDYMDSCCYQINISTSNSVGTITIQGSLDYVPASSPTLANAGNWADLSFGGDAMTINAADDVWLLKMDMIPFHALRVKYVSSVAGTGTCTIIMQNKTLGA